MILEPVTHPTVTFVAVSERTSDLWAGVMLGLLGGVPWFLVLFALVHLLGIAR